ncbi:MAG TPA: NAD-dependent epimerase/dehydratase family protein, partial [Candidatus Baltobacteraceae bacterium]
MTQQRAFAVTASLNTLQTLATRVIIAALGVATGLIVARWLGPEGKGVYSGMQTLLALPIAISGGGGAVITYALTKQRRTIGELFPALFAAFAILCALALAGCAAYAAVRGWTLEALVLGLSLPPSIVLSWQPSYYVAEGNVRRLNVQTLAIAIFTFVAISVAVVVLHDGIAGALTAWLAGLYTFAAIVVNDMVRGGARLHVREFAARFRDLANVGSQSALNAALGTLNYRVDSLILIAMLGLPLFGVYSVAVSAGEMLFLISRAANTAIGREVGMGDRKRSAEITASTIRAGFAVCGACALPIAIFAPLLIHALYGSRFDAGALPLRLLLPGIVAFASAGTFAAFFIFQLGRPVFVTAVNALMIATQAIACVALVPRFGLAGAAISSSATYVIGAAVNTLLFVRLTGIPARRIWLLSRSDMRAILSALHSRGGGAPAPSPGTHVVLTGAAGTIATAIRAGLSCRYQLVLTDNKSVTGVRQGRERFVKADLRSLAQIRKTVRGANAVVHLGGVSKESSFDAISDANIRGTYNVLEAARLEGVPRVIVASTGHVTGFYPKSQTIDESAMPRPDSLYAVSKVYAEALASYYCDKFGMNVFCLRIGHVSAKPEYAVDRSIWLSPGDLLQLLELAMQASPGFHVVYAASENESPFWSTERARALGYRPLDGARAWQCPAEEMQTIARLVQGESFAGDGFCGDLDRLSGRRPVRYTGCSTVSLPCSHSAPFSRSR